MRRLPRSDVSRSRSGRVGDAGAPGLTNNTTLTLVVTNQRLEIRELQRLAIQVHQSMARGIQPFSTTADGDTLFAVTTDEVDNPQLPAMELSTIASEMAWDAILASVPPPDPARPTAPIRISKADLDAVVGTYEFPSGARVTVRREGDHLRTTLTGSGGIFFASSGNTLIPVAPREFVIQGQRQDRILFETGSGRVAGMTLNPGQWGQRARRVL